MLLGYEGGEVCMCEREGRAIHVRWFVELRWVKRAACMWYVHSYAI